MQMQEPGQRRRSGAEQEQKEKHRAALVALGYEVQCLKGRGGFAQVWEARHRRTGLNVAVKIIQHQEPSSGGGLGGREVRVMRALRHPHVARLYEAIVTEEHTYMVMELAELGQLHDHVVLHGRLAEGEARRIFHQVISAVAYCHHNMVVHRDLKLENLLLDSERNVKLVDFGFATFFTYTGRRLSEPCGSPAYAAPELHSFREYVGPEVDVWSCGVILYVLLCGAYPFDGHHMSQQQRNIRGEYQSIPARVSDDARDLISSMLVVSPHKRATIADVTTHRWLHRGGAIPRYLAMPPLRAATQTTMIDEETLQQVARLMGLDDSGALALAQSLENGVDNEATVSYEVMASRRFDGPALYLRSAEVYHVEEEVAAAAECPLETMRRVAGALRELPVLLLFTTRHLQHGSSYYTMLCTAPVINITSPAPAGVVPSAAVPVLFEIQVYKYSSSGGWQGKYAMDLMRLSGPRPAYHRICTLLASKLRDISSPT